MRAQIPYSQTFPYISINVSRHRQNPIYMKFRHVVFKLSSGGARQILRLISTDAGESTPGQTILSFQVHARRGLPVRHGSSETTVGRRREPPSQTILLFQVLSSARLTRPTRRLLKPSSDVGESLPARQTYLSSLTLGEAYPSNTAGIVPPLDVGESLPARQTHPFRLLAPRYRTPSNATCPAVQAILAFSPLPARFNRPTHEY